ncbi:MAG: metallophosphoesterase [Halobacteriales archaeon]|nr:metallophosphoesterase [Halobacteriales archaeon]
MSRIAHLSDLHFGRADPRVVAGLLADLRALRPDLVAVSGDLTQRARRSEFVAARAFLDQLPAPWLAVPGNHDIPLHNVARRLGWPLHRFRAAIAPEPLPKHADGQVAALGLNTAWHLVWKGGRVTPLQVAAVRHWSAQQGGRLRIVVAHHPFSPPAGGRGHSLVRGWQPALLAMEEAGVDIVLTGHHHIAGRSESRAHAVDGPHRVVLVGAGTATSVRVRGEPNSYNLLHAAPGRLRVERRDWDGQRFGTAEEQEYVGWQALPDRSA